MLRLLALLVVNLISSSIALIVASLVLEDMSLDASGFIVAVLVFTGVGMLVEPLLRDTAFRNAPALLGSSALVSAFISLVVTALLTDGLSISGFSTWILATIIVWLVALLARFLLPFLIFRHVLRESRERRGK
jgi:hypothetical protein